MDVDDGTGNGISTSSAWRRQTGPKIDNLYFLRDGSTIRLTQSGAIRMQSNIGDPFLAPSGPSDIEFLSNASLLGKRTIDASLSRIDLSSSDLPNLTPAISTWRRGPDANFNSFTGNDQDQTIGAPNFSFGISKSEEVLDFKNEID